MPDIVLWSPKDVNSTAMYKFMQFVNKKHHLKLSSYPELYKYSTSYISAFWADIWEFCGVISSKPYTKVVDESVPIYEIPKWFHGARMNYAENLLKRTDDEIAIIATSYIFLTADETDKLVQLTFKQLRSSVMKCANALRKAGIKVGDRIAGFVPNCAEAVVFMLATTAVGAIWTSASPDFGEKAVLDRFKQIEPRILLSVESVKYGGKIHDIFAKLGPIIAGLPTVEKVVIISNITRPNLGRIPKSVLFDDFVASGDDVVCFEQVPFEQPAVILYSSGTTGVPKCIVHCQGGMLVQHMKEHIIHGSMKPGDRYFYYTTTGWMMWNYLISGLVSGASIVLYDGNPVYPDISHLWKLAEKLKITIFGTSAKFIQNVEEANYFPGEDCDLSSIHSIYSTGSSLKPASYDFIYKKIKKDVLVASITGGTDIVSLFAGHNSALPVYRGEIQCITLGMAVEAWNDAGDPVIDKPGDLVCTKPFPVMPVFFWNDKDGSKYQAAYFNQVRGVWYHGDYLSINSKTGGVLMLGRSDGTLNPAGVRFGSAELYNILTAFADVKDSLAVGQQTADGERVVLFLKMADGKQFNKALVDSIKQRIKTKLSARHVPAVILPIGDIPYTLTGKKVEIAVKKIISGENVQPSSSLTNPESLKLYYAIKSKL
ncbi:hypothetical protein HDV01_007587 [Terramyces sp. JEL0728]|nr:hypothetical protein HDV01_007587 [Terramyces sp. JEL0728]